MQPKKRVAIIGTVGVPACYGGFETLADQLVNHLDHQYDLSVYCSGKKYPKAQRQTHYKGAKLHFLPLEANGIQSIPYDTFSILHALFTSDVLLVLGVAGAWLFPFIRLFTRKKIIVSIDGIEWKRDKWNSIARWYLWWAEKIAVRYSHLDISDNESIQDYTAQRYGTVSNIIEYGADHTLTVKPTRADHAQFSFLGQPYAFSVCRIEPENNVHVVLSAFAQLPEHTLVFVGNWNKSAYGRALKEQYAGVANIQLLDPIYDQRTLDLLRGNAYLYLHGHSAGGTNPSLVEAMYLGLPVIAYSVSYNRTTTDHKAYYFRTEEDLCQVVRTTRITQLKATARTLEAIAKNRYTWPVVADKYRFLVEKALVIGRKKEVKPQLAAMDQQNLLNNGMSHLANQQLFFESN